MTPEDRMTLILAPDDDPRAQALGMVAGGDLLSPSPARREELRTARAIADATRMARMLAQADPVALGIAMQLLASAKEQVDG